MLRGYSLPRTPKGTSSLVPTPPWHYAGTCLSVAYEADPEAVRSLLPPGLEFCGPQCAAYFVEWQYATDSGEEYLDPATSQYHEAIFLISASYEGSPCSYCPFIWVDQDVSLARGLIQGWPKQLGSIWITRASELSSKAAPAVGSGGRFGATLASRDRRLAEAVVTLREPAAELPTPNFARAILCRHFPELAAGRHDRPAIYELVQLKSRDVQISPIWKGDASLQLFDQPQLELSELRPARVIAGYRFSCAMTVDDLVFLRDLRGE